MPNLDKCWARAAWGIQCLQRSMTQIIINGVRLEWPGITLLINQGLHVNFILLLGKSLRMMSWIKCLSVADGSIRRHSGRNIRALAALLTLMATILYLVK